MFRHLIYNYLYIKKIGILNLQGCKFTMTEYIDSTDDSTDGSTDIDDIIELNSENPDFYKDSEKRVAVLCPATLKGNEVLR